MCLYVFQFTVTGESGLNGHLAVELVEHQNNSERERAIIPPLLLEGTSVSDQTQIQISSDKHAEQTAVLVSLLCTVHQTVLLVCVGLDFGCGFGFGFSFGYGFVCGCSMPL
jgi:hypothetical protein